MSIPLLGEMAVNAHGDTYSEAREALENSKRDFLETWLKHGVDIPEPPSDKNKINFKELKAIVA